MKKALSLVLAVLMMVTTCALAETKTGTAKGFGGDVTVTLTVEDGKITACSIDAANETPAIGGAAVDELAAQVVAANGAEIDGVTGASFTSDGVKAAVTAAMSTATEAAKMVPGTYTASAMGINDIVTVEVTVSEDKIENVVVTYNQETAGIGAPLYDKNGELCANGGTCPILLIPAKIVENQTLAVDTVSGATVTSNAVIKAVGEAITAAGGNTADFQGEAAKESLDDLYASADVVVVGAGGAGLAAAISAGQTGKSVIVLEKTGSVGGDTLVCGAQYNTPDREGQSTVPMSDSIKSTIEAALAETPVSDEHAALIAEVKTEWEAFQANGEEGTFDSAAWYTLQTWNGGDKVGNLELIRTYADNAFSSYEWVKSLGMEFMETVGQAAGALWQRSHTSKMNMGTGFISTYLDTINGMDNVNIYTNMKATNLVKDETGRVTGVICTDVNGDQQTFTANNGVVIATGGFSANGEMVQSYNTTGKWDDLTNVPTTNRNDCSQGDGIAMATEIGAATVDMDQVQLLFLGNLVDGGLTKYPARCVTGVVQTVFVNKNGERFVQEDGRRDQICKAVLAQPDAYFYIIESADGSQYTDITSPDWRSADGFTREYLEENGYLYVADTLEELAEKINIDPATLVASVESYNACADAGVDAEFGRTNFGCKLENGPFYATPRQACVHHTMGGLKINSNTNVLDTDGNIIPGLYAAGEVTGAIHGGNRLGGNAVTDTVVYGKLAGAAAAANN